MKLTKNLIRRLPKPELHCHLEGSLRVKTEIDLEKKQKNDIPSYDNDELKKILNVGKNIGSLEEYIKRFDITLAVLQTPESLIRAAYELTEDCALDGVRYLEVRYSPILHTHHGMTLAETVDAVYQGLSNAEKDFNIKTGIILCGIRHISPEVSLKLADLTVQFKNKGVVGFDLAGAEENFPAKHHQEAFSLILRNNINTTLHAGEAYGPESIHQAIHYCGAHRIGHGTRLKENPELMDYVNDHRIALEMCLTSNIQTKSIRSFREHPFRYYLNKHLRVTLNTDNRLISNTTLTDEYWLAHEQYGLTLSNFRNVIINGFKSAFMHHIERRKMINHVLDELESEFGFKKRVIV